MKGFPRRGSDTGMPADAAIIDDPASMKGFPRRGSDATPPTRPSPAGPSLNEGLPQKGKRWRT